MVMAEADVSVTPSIPRKVNKPAKSFRWGGDGTLSTVPATSFLKTASMTNFAPNPVEATMAVLAASGMVRANEALMMALEIPREIIQTAAAEAIVHRSTINAQLELLSRFDRLPPGARAAIGKAGDTLEPALRQMLLRGDGLSRTRALKIIEETRQFQQIPHLLELLKQPTLGDLAKVNQVLWSLIDALYDSCRSTRPAEDGLLAAEALRRWALKHLEAAATDYDKLAVPESVLKGILILAEPSHPAVKRVLWNGPPPCRERAGTILLESRHPGVLRHLAAALSQAYPHPKVLEAIHLRSDPEMIGALLRTCEERLSGQQQQNLRQIQSLPWLDIAPDLIASIPPNLQPALVRFIAATKVANNIKLAIHEWLLRHGTPAGRQAADDHLPMIEEDVVQAVVRESLEDEDAQVQAWAVHQLRQHAIPEAFALLIERLDSPNEDVRSAAHSELASFNIDRVLQMVDDFSTEEARVAGRLVLKVDADAVTKLRRLLAQPIRQKRIRVAREVAKLGLQATVPEAFIAMTDDVDPVVRRTAVEILGTIPTKDAFLALERLQSDPHPRVRTEVETTLQRWMAISSTNRA